MKTIGLFLISYWLYIDGVDTIIKMAVKMGSSIGFETADLITALLMVQFIAFPSSVVYSWFSKKIGVKNAVLVAIFGYSPIYLFRLLYAKQVSLLLFSCNYWIISRGIQALSRSLYTRLIPPNREAEFLAFITCLENLLLLLDHY